MPSDFAEDLPKDFFPAAYEARLVGVLLCLVLLQNFCMSLKRLIFKKEAMLFSYVLIVVLDFLSKSW